MGFQRLAEISHLLENLLIKYAEERWGLALL
jgi:hypothetical protein